MAIDKTYENFLRHIRDNGVAKMDRTGTGTISTFGHQMRFNLQKGFPLITTKKVHFKSVLAELLWFLSGSTNVKDLQALGCTIWDEWADENGDLGPIYGHQWTNWTTDDGGSIDQITVVIDEIKRNRNSRRLLVSAWNVADLGKMALMPCHAFFQFYVANGCLSLQVYQRSADAFLGVPFNIASYALLVHMVAQQCNLVVGDLIWTGGDCHIYSNHFEQVGKQLLRTPREYPTLRIKRKPQSIFDYKLSDFELIGYEPHDAIPAPVAV